MGSELALAYLLCFVCPIMCLGLGFKFAGAEVTALVVGATVLLGEAYGSGWLHHP